jgi:hypothetical protein
MQGILDLRNKFISEIFKYCVKDASIPLVLTCKRFHSIVVGFDHLVDVHQKNISDPAKFTQRAVRNDQIQMLSWFINQCTSQEIKYLYHHQLINFHVLFIIH